MGGLVERQRRCYVKIRDQVENRVNLGLGITDWVNAPLENQVKFNKVVRFSNTLPLQPRVPSILLLPVRDAGRPCLREIGTGFY